MSQDFVRGTSTGRTYKYSSCTLSWNGNEWVATDIDTGLIITTGESIKQVRDKIYNLKVKRERK